MLGIGLVGLGFMGMIHYLAYRQVAEGRVVALCSRSEAKLSGDWTSIQGNFGPKGTIMDLSDSTPYRDYGRMLEDPEVHLVDLCVPNAQHAAMAIRAFEAGKHVLVEKPIALTLEDADRMIAAATAHERTLLVAHVLPFVPEFAFALDLVRSATYGRLRAAHLKRIISRPDWSEEIEDVAHSGGPAIDLHIHDTHFMTLLAGAPERVRTSGIVDGGSVVHLATQYDYPSAEPPVAMSSLCGALSQRGRSFTHGFEMFLEQATVSFDFANIGGQGHQATPLSVYLADGTIQQPILGSGDPVGAFVTELSEATRCISSGGDPGYLAAGAARDALAVCLAEIESAREHRPVEVR